VPILSGSPSSFGQSNGLSQPYLLDLIAIARQSPHLPLTDEARTVWDSEYLMLLERQLSFLSVTKECALAEVTNLARLYAAETGAPHMSRTALLVGLQLWQLSHSHDGTSPKHGIVFDDDSCILYWAGKKCGLKRAWRRYQLFRGLIHANVALSRLKPPAT